MARSPSPPLKGAGSGRIRADGRRQLLVYIRPDVIKDTKKAALDRDTTASAVVEEALQEWLARHARGRQ